ncbi:MAG: hypothetical protein VX777_06695 [Chlamydiota bacterium]|nr:hypothetical protein [Chlamydiota bacterium]
MTQVITGLITRNFATFQELFLCLKNDYNAFVNNRGSVKLHNTFSENFYNLFKEQEKVETCYLYEDYKVTLTFDKNKEVMTLLQQLGLKRFPVFYHYSFVSSNERGKFYIPAQITVEFPKDSLLDSFDETNLIIKKILQLNLQATLSFLNVQTEKTRYQIKPIKCTNVYLEGIKDKAMPGLTQEIPYKNIGVFNDIAADKIDKIFFENVSYHPLVEIDIENKIHESDFGKLKEFNPGLFESYFSKKRP